MRKKLALTCYVILAVFCLSGSNCGRTSPASGHPAPATTANPPTQENAETWSSNPGCHGGNRVTASPSPSDQNMALSLLYAIRSWRLQQNLGGLYDPPAPAATTVAFFHAEDMNGNSYVNLVSSDGENVNQHLACMGGPIVSGGTVVVGQSGNVADVLNYMVANGPSMNVLSMTNASHITVGYSNGYWCVIIY